MSGIHVASHHAMNTWWQVRIAGEEEAYAAQAAQAAFAITDRMESLMSRFRDDSEVSALAALPTGGRRRLSREVFDCLALAAEVQKATEGAFHVCATEGRPEIASPRWHLDHATVEFVADSAPCVIDLGAIAKGFSLDRMAEELHVWGIKRFLLMSSGSSILAGDAPDGQEGWAVRLGDGAGSRELPLCRRALGTSGFDMRGRHIIDPSTGNPASRYRRSWALAPTAAEADALSTAWMNMEREKIERLCARSDGMVAACLLDLSGFGNMHGVGFEPTTPSVSGRCATTAPTVRKLSEN